MSWDNIATAFTKYSKIFGTSPSTSPMSWDSRRQELHWESCHKSPKRKSIMLWHFNYIFGVHFAYTLSTVYFLVQQLFGYGPKKELLNVIYLLLIGNGIETWHLNFPSQQDLTLISREDVIQKISNHEKFHHLTEPPSDLVLTSKRESFLNLHGYFDKVYACEAYRKGPFRLVREDRYRPRATIFFSLICIGNYSFGLAESDAKRKHVPFKLRGKARRTYDERIQVDFQSHQRFSINPYIGTINQGFSFMTCYSREAVSFKVFLNPFEFEVWIIILFTMTILVVVLVLILTTKLKWKWVEAISFAQLVVISNMFEKPTTVDGKIETTIQFRIQFGVLMLLIPILTNGYLGLSITSISASLEHISVTRFDQLSKPVCNGDNGKCHIDRLKRFEKYLETIEKHMQIISLRRFFDYKGLLKFFKGDRTNSINKTFESIINKSVRRFDVNSDFVLLPYPIEIDVAKYQIGPNVFYNRLLFRLRETTKIVLTLFESSGKISKDSIHAMRMFDLLEPWRIPHPQLGNLSNMRNLENIWDIEHELVKCKRTALVLDEIEINREIRYFEKYYPWLKFFKATSAILPSESGWYFDINGKPVTPQIIERLYVAGIVQLLEAWPYRVSELRENITKQVHTLVERKPRENVVKDVSLGGNIQTIFWIYLILLVVAFAITLVVEARIHKKLWKGLLYAGGRISQVY
ncbi:hypothetical protein Fcan01_23034 [Folsomia candida]|uniref:Uncharacterized protein n=1 Tax=Folsomia candida TaxID=158441 RepID=A0A226D8Z1_FOLCA|nr:hypothetical protein Fcan01_23034 [Folsomia candida]